MTASFIGYFVNPQAELENDEKTTFIPIYHC